MTIAPRWRKVLGDIAERPVRTSVAVVAMAAGTFGLGAILSSYAILGRELRRTYLETRPASAILVLDRVSDPLVESVRRLPGVADAEARPMIRGRIRVGRDEWAPLVLFVVRDFDDLRIDRLRREAGAWSPGEDEVLLERTALPVARAAIGDRVTIRTAGGTDRSLRVSGSVHAPGLAPAWMDHVVSGFVAWRSIARADAPAETAELRIVAAGAGRDVARIRTIASRVKDALLTQGRAVTRIDVPPPGRHPHADQMDTFLFLLGAFGGLTLILSAVLVANMIHALLSEQTRQIGVMKALGASTGQVAALYLGQVAILAVVSLGLGIPLGLSMGRGYTRFSASMLNADLASTAVPLWVIAAQIAVGFAVPLVVALVPVHGAARLTVRQALDHEAGQRSCGPRRLDDWIARITWLPRPLRLSLRTTFARRGRLVLTVGTLAAGGAVFMAALNVSAALGRAVAADDQAHRYDLDVRLTGLNTVDRVAGAVAEVPDVLRAEYWSEGTALLVLGNGAADERVGLVGPDRGSTLFDPPLLSGRWLAPGDEAAVVINQALLARDGALHVGGRLGLRVATRDVSWPIVGVVRELQPAPVAYAPARAVLEALGQPGGMARTVRVVTREHDGAAQLGAQRAIERALERAGVGVLFMQRQGDRRKAIEDHFVIVVSALMLATGLVVLVGGLGLTSTLTLNVLERTREMGILRAIGAAPRVISRYVLFEGLLMGVLSWGLALLMAVPVTFAIDVVTGRIFFNAPLGFFMSPGAAAAWLGLVVILASLSSLYPAWRAGRLVVREALAYA